MKYILSIAFLMFIFFTACNEDDNKNLSGGDIEITEIMPKGVCELDVKAVKLSPALHSLSVSWDKPDKAEEIGHYLVEWRGSVGDKSMYSKSVDSKLSSLVIDRLYNEEYTVTVKCVSKDYLYSKGVSATAMPIVDKTAPGKVSDLVIEPLAVSAAINWKNPVDDDFEKVHLTVFDVTNNTEITTLELSSLTTSYQLVELQEMNEYRVSITTSDYIGNVSEPLTQTIKTLTEVLLDKTQTPWEIVDFSTEEASGEGATGRAKDAIDGDDATFWHSRWKGDKSSLPQWIIFDMKQEVVPTLLISYKRKNNKNGPTSVRIEGSLDNVNWNDFGTFSLSATNDDGQNCNLKKPKKVRYIRYTVLASPNNYAMVRNINIRALIGK